MGKDVAKKNSKYWLKKNSSSRKNEIYGNCKVYSIHGELMFLCVEKKANWYLDRVDEITKKPLAVEIRHINAAINFLMILLGIHPKWKKVQLMFKTENGNKGDKYSLSKKKNICVVSGSKTLSNLTTHHITPHCYRRYLPEEYKNANSHDIVPIRSGEHYNYELEADKLKAKLNKKYKVSTRGHSEVNHTLFYAIKSAHAIKKYGDKIPKDKLVIHKENIRKHTEQKRVTQKAIDNLIKIRYEEAKKAKSPGELIVENLIAEGPEAIQAFVEMWRQHFIDTMKPKYMPKYWDVKRPASRL